MKAKKLGLLILLLPLVSACGTYYPPSYWQTIEIGIDEEFTNILAVYFVTPESERDEELGRPVYYYYSQSEYAMEYVYESVCDIHYKKIVENYHGNDQNGALVFQFYNSESMESYWVYIYDIYAVTPELEEGQAYFTGNYAWYNLYIFADEFESADEDYFPQGFRNTYYID